MLKIIYESFHGFGVAVWKAGRGDLDLALLSC